MYILAIGLPIFYLLHCFEEFYMPGGFIPWYRKYRPTLSTQKPGYYFRVNLVAFLIVLANSIYYFTSHGDNNTGLLLVTSFLASNAIFTHLVGAIKLHVYSPGIVTGIIFYVLSYVITVCLILTKDLLPLKSVIIYSIIGILYEAWNLYKNIKNN